MSLARIFGDFFSSFRQELVQAGVRTDGLILSEWKALVKLKGRIHPVSKYSLGIQRESYQRTYSLILGVMSKKNS